jgi:hypothetical protein
MVVLHSVNLMSKSFKHLCIIGGMYILFCGGGGDVRFSVSRVILYCNLLCSQGDFAARQIPKNFKCQSIVIWTSVN